MHVLHKNYNLKMDPILVTFEHGKTKRIKVAQKLQLGDALWVLVHASDICCPSVVCDTRLGFRAIGEKTR